MLRRMNLKTNKLIIQEQIEELGMELWGIINFETDIKNLYDYLKIEPAMISMSDFIEWVVFPEIIPPDFRHTLRMKLITRHTDAEYSSEPSSELTLEETVYQEQVTEWLHYKYQAHNASEQRFYHLYKMTPKAVRQFFRSMYLNGHVSEDTNLRFLTYYYGLQDEQD